MLNNSSIRITTVKLSTENILNFFQISFQILILGEANKARLNLVSQWTQHQAKREKLCLCYILKLWAEIHQHLLSQFSLLAEFFIGNVQVKTKIVVFLPWLVSPQ